MPPGDEDWVAAAMACARGDHASLGAYLQGAAWRGETEAVQSRRVTSIEAGAIALCSLAESGVAIQVASRSLLVEIALEAGHHDMVQLLLSNTLHEEGEAAEAAAVAAAGAGGGPFSKGSHRRSHSSPAICGGSGSGSGSGSSSGSGSGSSSGSSSGSGSGSGAGAGAASGADSASDNSCDSCLALDIGSNGSGVQSKKQGKMPISSGKMRISSGKMPITRSLSMSEIAE